MITPDARRPLVKSTNLATLSGFHGKCISIVKLHQAGPVEQNGPAASRWIDNIVFVCDLMRRSLRRQVNLSFMI